MDNVGYGGVRVNERRLPDEQLTTVFDKAEAMAKLMDRLGYSAFWMAEHHFSARGHGVHPKRAHGGIAPRACDEEHQARLRF